MHLAHTHTRSLLFENLFFLHTDEICTNISVPACTSSATNCQQINNELLEQFKQINHDVYAQECMETTGGYCLYTDVTYGTCSSAKASELLSIKLSIVWALITIRYILIMQCRTNSALCSLMEQRGVLQVRKNPLPPWPAVFINIFNFTRNRTREPSENCWIEGWKSAIQTISSTIATN